MGVKSKNPSNRSKYIFLKRCFSNENEKNNQHYKCLHSFLGPFLIYFYRNLMFNFYFFIIFFSGFMLMSGQDGQVTTASPQIDSCCWRTSYLMCNQIPKLYWRHRVAIATCKQHLFINQMSQKWSHEVKVDYKIVCGSLRP